MSGDIIVPIYNRSKYLIEKGWSSFDCVYISTLQIALKYKGRILDDSEEIVTSTLERVKWEYLWPK